MSTPEWTPRNRALILAAVTGAKLTLGPALMQTARRQPSAKNWVAAAMGEMIVDKLGVLGPRYHLSSLIPRVLAGAWVARESLKSDDADEDLQWIATCAATAAGVAVALPVVRMALSKLGLPDILLGLVEDVVAVRLGASAVDMSMDEITEVAKDSIENLKDQIGPALEQLRDRAAASSQSPLVSS